MGVRETRGHDAYRCRWRNQFGKGSGSDELVHIGCSSRGISAEIEAITKPTRTHERRPRATIRARCLHRRSALLMCACSQWYSDSQLNRFTHLQLPTMSLLASCLPTPSSLTKYCRLTFSANCFFTAPNCSWHCSSTLSLFFGSIVFTLILNVPLTGR